MSSRCQRLAIAIVCAWTRLYTWRMPPALGQARRAEIESDLWEFQQDSSPGGVGPALHVLARLVIGVPDDLAWRSEQFSFAHRRRRRAFVATACTAALGAAVLWVVSSVLLIDLPRPPAAPPPQWTWQVSTKPPPPPPPPPPLPPGFTSTSSSVPFPPPDAVISRLQD